MSHGNFDMTKWEFLIDFLAFLNVRNLPVTLLAVIAYLNSETTLKVVEGHLKGPIDSSVASGLIQLEKDIVGITVVFGLFSTRSMTSMSKILRANSRPTLRQRIQT